MNTPRICFVIPYFGRWPSWFPFFLESCRFNPDVDWLLFTDCGVPDNVPGNVSIREVTFDAYCAQVSERLGIRFNPHSAYKLCDLKPALGYLHEDQLRGYDFWAFGDIDLIYGNLRGYFTPERLAAHDLHATHEMRISGHLCLLRNDSTMNRVFMQARNWRAQLENPAHLAFDESAFCHLFIRHKNWPETWRRWADRFNPLRRRSEFKEAFSTPNGRLPWIDGSRCYPTAWFWNSGRLTNDLDGEHVFPYFHFMVWKKAWQESGQAVDTVSPVGHSWKIDRSGFKNV